MSTTTTKTWFTKTIARDTLAKALKDMVEFEEIDQTAADKLNKLFASARSGGGVSTSVFDDDGVLIGKKCSVLGRYLPISEFGTVGKDDEGNIKYSYQSKAGAKIMRDKKSELAKALTQADEDLEETEDIAAWKQAKADAKTEYDAPVESTEGYETAEELKEALQ